MKFIGRVLLVAMTFMIIGACGMTHSSYSINNNIGKQVASEEVRGQESQPVSEMAYHTSAKPSVAEKTFVDKKEEKPPVVSLTKAFKDRLIQKTTQDYVVTQFKTKKALIQYLTEIMDRKLATKLVDHYYTEKNGVLKIIPMDFIPWFDSNQPYKLTKMSPKIYQLTQHTKSDLHGENNLTIIFKKVNDKWIIEKVKINDYTI